MWKDSQPLSWSGRCKLKNKQIVMFSVHPIDSRFKKLGSSLCWMCWGQLLTPGGGWVAADFRESRPFLWKFGACTPCDPTIPRLESCLPEIKDISMQGSACEGVYRRIIRVNKLEATWISIRMNKIDIHIYIHAMDYCVKSVHDILNANKIKLQRIICNMILFLSFLNYWLI